MNAKERLIKFLNYISISQRKFEESVGLSNGFVNNIGDSIRVRSLEKISSVYPDLNTAWLLTGEGSMLKGSNNITQIGSTGSIGGVIGGNARIVNGDTAMLQSENDKLKKKVEELEALVREKDDIIKTQIETINNLIKKI